MAHRVLEVTLLSAKDLKKVNLITRMEVYAVATISGDPLTRQCTPPDPYGGRHPSWNTTLRFAVPPTASAAGGCLHVLLRTERSRGDRDVGEVVVPLAEILAGACPGDFGARPSQFASYQVRKVHRCEPRGVLHLSYRLGPVIAPQVPHARADEPAVAYPMALPFHPPPYTYLPPPLLLPPPPPQAAGYVAVTPAPQAAGHVAVPPPPKAAGHVAVTPAPQAAGHVAVPPPAKAAGHVAASPRKGNHNGNLDFGMGLGAGLVGGAIGGMLAGDMMSDAAAYNAGYRAGLAEGGGAVF